MNLPRFVSTFDSPLLQGMGLSSSSAFSVLLEVSGRYLDHASPPMDRDDLIRAALRRERFAAGGAGIAANDVATIVYGGVVLVMTEGTEDVFARPIPHDPSWIAAHAVLGVNRHARPHSSAGILDAVFRDPDKARSCTRQFTALAERAAQAIAHKSLGGLADVVNIYRERFQQLTVQYITAATEKVAALLAARLGKRMFAYKAPGAGAADSIVALVQDSAEAVEILQREGWWATPVHVSAGLRCDMAEPNKLRWSVAHRIDWVGLSDVGQDWRLLEPGTCCSTAVHPRSELTIVREHS